MTKFWSDFCSGDSAPVALTRQWSGVEWAVDFIDLKRFHACNRYLLGHVVCKYCLQHLLCKQRKKFNEYLEANGDFYCVWVLCSHVKMMFVAFS